MHVDTRQSHGRIGVWESEESPGDRLPLHVHEREDEHVVVLEGEILVRVGDRTERLGAGAATVLPRGVPHAHAVIAPRARILTIAVPGGFERLFTELGVPALPGTAPPPRPNNATVAAAVRRLGVRIVGPPPAFDAE